LNAERMLREDRDSAGATALMICLIAHGWAQRDESDLHQLFDALWGKSAALGPGLGRLAGVAAAARPDSVLLAYWRARVVYAEDPAAGVIYWRALLQCDGVPGDYVHEALLSCCAHCLEQGGRVSDADTDRLVAGLSRTDEEQSIPRAVLRHLWEWAIERNRPDVMRLLLSLNLSPEAWVLRQSLLEGLMAGLVTTYRQTSGQFTRPVGQ
jgi:hypothetical protein